jgi:hypothetical protein
MSMLEAIEQKILFRFTRLLSFLIIIILCIIIGFAVWFYFSFKTSTQVSLNDMKVSLAAPAPGDSSTQMGYPASDIPPEIAKYFVSDEERAMFLEGITTLEPEQRRDFMTNLTALIREGERKGLNTADLITQYKMVKLSKLSGNEFDKYTQQAQKAAVVFFILMLIGMIAMFSLILVMLAIERNTRHLKI